MMRRNSTTMQPNPTQPRTTTVTLDMTLLSIFTCNHIHTHNFETLSFLVPLGGVTSSHLCLCFRNFFILRLSPRATERLFFDSVFGMLSFFGFFVLALALARCHVLDVIVPLRDERPQGLEFWLLLDGVRWTSDGMTFSQIIPQPVHRPTATTPIITTHHHHRQRQRLSKKTKERRVGWQQDQIESKCIKVQQLSFHFIVNAQPTHQRVVSHC